jgi:CRISPR-associated endonuclease/helicase Cas3
VATQTIEVGANIDLDAMVTESAALPALVQRLGRLNRLGRPGSSPALVVHDPASGPDDPVYGPAREATWNWLSRLADPLTPRPGARPDTALLGDGLDVSPLALRRLQSDLFPDEREAMRPPEPYVPVLDHETLGAWAQTSPAPHPDPPVAPYLHGLGRGLPDVSIVWRAGLPADTREWTPMLRTVPPVADEALDAPVAAVRRWLAGVTTGGADFADVDGQPDTSDDVFGPTDGLVAVRYRGPQEDPQPVRAGGVRAGDLIVVRSEHGGCDEFGWNPASTDPVPDVADLADRSGRPILRLRPELLATVNQYHPTLVPALADLVMGAAQDAREEGLNSLAYRQALAGMGGELKLPLPRNLRRLAQGCTAVAVPAPGDVPTVLLAKRGGGQRGDDEVAASSANGSGKRIGLIAHQQAVAVRAAEFARNLRLPEDIADAVCRAALLHDEGKRDERFQAMLYERPLRAHAQSPLLAKSGMDPADRPRFARARRNAEYPSGMRHEALSARIARIALEDDGLDTELIVHLVAAHHGRNRPLLPAIADPNPVSVSYGSAELLSNETVDWANPKRFAELNERYGRWGLALLESIVRLADIWCSEREEGADT